MNSTDGKEQTESAADKFIASTWEYARKHGKGAQWVAAELERALCSEWKRADYNAEAGAQNLITSQSLRSRLAEAEKERDTALDNADFWERELNNFRRNAAARAEELAKDKVEAAESALAKMREALEKTTILIRTMDNAYGNRGAKFLIQSDTFHAAEKLLAGAALGRDKGMEGK